jgi:death-on-curing protein
MPTGFDLTVDDVLALHDEVMHRQGAASAPLRGGGLAALEAALVRPQHAEFYAGADVFEQASVLAVGVAQAHAFLDGNKRTATAVMITFLGLAGLMVRHGDAQMEFALRLENILIEVSSVTSQIAARELADWLRAVCDPI